MVGRSGFAIVAAGLSFAAAPAMAEDGLDLSGTLRLRYEGVHGQLRPGFNRDESVLAVRTTLRAAYDGDGPVGFVAELYDSRMYGVDRRSAISSNDVDALEIAQAHLTLDLDGTLGEGSRLGIVLGRFMPNIGSRRLIAADDYRNTTNSFTGVQAEFGKGRLGGTLIYSLPHIRRPDDIDSLLDNDVKLDKETFNFVLWGGTVHRDETLGPAMLELSYYHLGEDDGPGRATRNRSLDTYGGRILKAPRAGTLDYELEGYLQTGSIRASSAPAAAALDVRAWFVHAELGYQLAGSWKPRVSIEYDQVSGDGPGARFTRFDTLFGMRRADFAPSGIYASIGRANLVSPGVRFEWASKRSDGFLSWRPTWLDSRTDAFSTSNIRDASGRSGRFAGHVLDLRARWWAIPDRLRLELNATHVALGRFIRDAPNGLPRDGSSYLSAAFQVQF